MTRWEHLEDYARTAMLLGHSFTSRDYANATDISPREASRNIQAYLNSQRGPRARTEYILRRTPGTRTKNAQWAVGKRTADARAVGAVFNDDVRNRALRAFQPDLNRVAALNPRAARLIERQIQATLDGVLPLLALAVQGMAAGEDE